MFGIAITYGNSSIGVEGGVLEEFQDASDGIHRVFGGKVDRATASRFRLPFDNEALVFRNPSNDIFNIGIRTPDVKSPDGFGVGDRTIHSDHGDVGVGSVGDCPHPDVFIRLR